MAKAIALIASALCVLAVAGFAHAHEKTFTVQGKVYCDTCRVLFPTRVSDYIKDAKVELRCRSQENGTVTYTVSGTTCADGSYSLGVVGDHEDEICDVTVVSSPCPDCSEIVPEIDSSRVCLTKNSGILSSDRYANPIGFVKKEALPVCTEVLKELGFAPLLIYGSVSEY